MNGSACPDGQDSAGIKRDFYKMDYEAWDDGTVDLTLEEEAAYLRLCHQMYRMKGPVKNLDRLLCVLWRCHQNKARPLLQRLIAKGKIEVTEDGLLTNGRVRMELTSRERLGRHRADAGYTGGIRSGHARRKLLKTKESDEAKRSRVEKSREEIERKKDAAPNGAAPISPEAALFIRGREILGQNTGGLIKRLLTAKGGNVALARAAIEQASTKGDPREYVCGVINKAEQPSLDYGVDRW